MKRVPAVFLVFFVVFGIFSADAQAISVPADSAVVMDVDSGRLLFAQDGNRKLPMASTTKILTALVAIENGNLDDVVKVSQRAARAEGSLLYLREGDKITLRDLLYGLMLVSGNDAAEAIAEHVGGSVAGFADMMNAKAAELGASNSHFTNPHGLPDENHYTTAYDLTLITVHAMRNEIFSSIVATKYVRITINGAERQIKNKNKILWQYEGGIGVKTGYTKAAGRCLVSAAERDGMKIVSTVLDCGDMWNESIRLLNDTFATYKNYTVVKKDSYLGTVNVARGVKAYTDVYAPEEVKFVLTADEAEKIDYRINLAGSVKAPMFAGDPLGTLQVWLDGALIYETDLLAAETIEEEGYGYYLEKIIKAWLLPSVAR